MEHFEHVIKSAVEQSASWFTASGLMGFAAILWALLDSCSK